MADIDHRGDGFPPLRLGLEDPLLEPLGGDMTEEQQLVGVDEELQLQGHPHGVGDASGQVVEDEDGEHRTPVDDDPRDAGHALSAQGIDQDDEGQEEDDRLGVERHTADGEQQEAPGKGGQTPGVPSGP